MNIKETANSIIKEITMLELSEETESINVKLNDYFSAYNNILERTNAKALTLAIPEKVRFRFIKRVIGKLIRTHTSQQVDFNYQIIELIKTQQDIILELKNVISNISYENKILNNIIKK